MILVDTSVWVDHLRSGDAQLVGLLETSRVAAHPFVLGELACGQLSARQKVLGYLRALPALPVASDDEVLYFIDQHALMGRGIGYIDAHLLASVALHGQALLWSRDKRLFAVADSLGLALPPATH